MTLFRLLVMQHIALVITLDSCMIVQTAAVMMILDTVSWMLSKGMSQKAKSINPE